MEKSRPNWVPTLLVITSAYYAVCGITAIFTPHLWYTVAGIPPAESHLILNVVGGLMLGLACGAWVASKNPGGNEALLLAFLMANLFDFFVVVAAMAQELLPVLNSVGFLVVDAILIVCFWKARAKYPSCSVSS